MPNLVGPAPPCLELSPRNFPCRTPARVPGLGREQERGVQREQPSLRYSLSFSCSNASHVPGKGTAWPGGTTSSPGLEESPQGAPRHPFSVTPRREQGKRHQSPGRDQAGKNRGTSRGSQRGGDDGGGGERGGAEKGQRRRKGHLPARA